MTKIVMHGKLEIEMQHCLVCCMGLMHHNVLNYCSGIVCANKIKA